MNPKERQVFNVIFLIDVITGLSIVVELVIGIITAVHVALYAHIRDQFNDIWSYLLVACIIYISVPIVSIHSCVLHEYINDANLSPDRIDKVIETGSYRNAIKIFNMIHFFTLIIGVWAIALYQTMSVTHIAHVQEHQPDIWILLETHHAFGWFAIGFTLIVIDVIIWIMCCKKYRSNKQIKIKAKVDADAKAKAKAKADADAKTRADADALQREQEFDDESLIV